MGNHHHISFQNRLLNCMLDYFWLWWTGLDWTLCCLGCLCLWVPCPVWTGGCFWRISSRGPGCHKTLAAPWNGRKIGDPAGTRRCVRRWALLKRDMDPHMAACFFSRAMSCKAEFGSIHYRQGGKKIQEEISITISKRWNSESILNPRLTKNIITI